jgi:hypothetical protein
MGNYNPYSPIILGEEWVPIRNENLQFSPIVNSFEVGAAYAQAGAGRINNARFYANELTYPLALSQVAAVNLYPYGQEDQSGPLYQVIIPTNSVTTTGTHITLSSATTYPEALYQPGDTKYVQFAYDSGGLQYLSFYFNVDAYPELNNKRILNVSMLYSGAVQDADTNGNPATFVNPTAATQSMTLLTQCNDAGSGQQFSGKIFASNTGTLDELNTVLDPASASVFQGVQLGTLDLGDINNCWNTASLGSTEKMPWRYADLQRLQASAGVNRQQLKLQVVIPLTTGGIAGVGTAVRFFLDYVALRVIYCEETRVAYGAQQFGYSYGMNQVTMRDLTQAANPLVVAGRYLPTLSFVSMGQVSFGYGVGGSFPKLNAVRELYQIPSHPGVELNVPFPLEDRIGDVFTSETTHILPQLSLHASGGTMTEPHVYGRQVAAQVYGANTATQDIYDDISGVSAVYPQVRYYARRYGDTTVPLTLTGVGSLSGSTAAITVAEFDALQEILDGWKEVTLRFASPPSMGAVAGFPAWTWSAVAETAGNRWEVLGASAPAISGTPGSFYNPVPSPNALSSATYQPTGGTTAELTWMPQGVGTPFVTGASADVTSDAVLIFSQDPPTVSGVGLTALTQTVTGIGLDCGSLPCCIPSGIGYQRVTWGTSSLPPSGFGAYELQRFDAYDPTGNFQTIMLATSVAASGFNDYEARVGITSVYRIRALNVYNFAGQWSTYVSGAPPAPGVSGGCSDATGALIFTSNADQSGLSNAAYVMQWEGTPTEDFALPEADAVAYQSMYNRDGSVAFHGTERELETFSRTVLINAAAIDPIRLADAKTLRNLAWADLPYVCVRDDIGDRWFSSVRVPGLNARFNRTKYMGRIEIVETTLTPAPVDP